jgi:hypothetical protein
MTTFEFVRAASSLAVALALVGCAANPGVYKPAQDTTPSWMKSQVTGSRIPRRTDGRGKAISADFVRSVSPSEFGTLPGIVF